MVIKYVPQKKVSNTAFSHLKILASGSIQKQYDGGGEGRTGSLGLLTSIFKNILSYITYAEKQSKQILSSGTHFYKMKCFRAIPRIRITTDDGSLKLLPFPFCY